MSLILLINMGTGMCCNMVRDISLFQLMELKSIMQVLSMKEQVTHSVLLLMLVFNCYLSLTTTLKSSHGL